jgi:hypothetical protein
MDDRHWEAESSSGSLKFPVLYGTKVFITVFVRTRQRFLSWASWFHTTPSHLISSRFISKNRPVCSYSLVFRVDVFIQVFQPKFCTDLVHVTYLAHLTLPYLTVFISGAVNYSVSPALASCICYFPQHPVLKTPSTSLLPVMRKTMFLLVMPSF